MPPKKQFIAIKSRSKIMMVEEEEPNQAEIALGEFKATSLTFQPPASKGEAAIVVSFSCSVKLVRGDIVSIKLAGCSGEPGMVSVDSKDFRDSVFCYWSDLGGPEGKGGKGGAPAQTLIIQLRKLIPADVQITFAIPASSGILLPEKLPATSSKLKIEGTRVLHAIGSSKIQKTAITTFTEIKKKLPQEELVDLETIDKEIVSQGILDEDELRIASDVTVQEWDSILCARRDVSQLKMGMLYRVEQQVFHQPQDILPIATSLLDIYKEHNVKRGTFALHQELARNFGVDVSKIMVFEESCFLVHGQFYPELTRGALMMLRLWTCDASDLRRIFGVYTTANVQREILFAMRSDDIGLITNWIHSISALLTSTRPVNYIPSELIPVLYRGLKEVSNEAFTYYHSLRPGDVVAFPTFTTLSVDVNVSDENFSCPDNAVLFEIHGLTEGVELGDVSQFPEDLEWLAPPFATFTVQKVEQLVEKNNLLKVELHMRTSLGGMMRDECFPEEASKAFRVHVTKLRSQDMPVLNERSSLLCKLIQCRVRQSTVKQMHPDFLTHVQYLEQYANVKRASQAKKLCEDGIVKWEQNTNEADSSAWDPIQKKTSILIEGAFQKCTKTQRTTFLAPDMNLDFVLYTMQAGGPKGPTKRIRRVMGKHVTHPYNPL